MSITTDRFIHKLRQDLIHILHPLTSFFFEINSTCNLNCKHCYIPPQFKQNILDYQIIEKILKIIKVKWSKNVGIAITGGEPLLHPKFFDIVNLLGKELFNWSLATNALLLDEEIIKKLLNNNCKTITISLDGDEKTHDYQRNKEGSYKKTLDSIDKLIDFNFPHIYITATIHDGNLSSLDNIYSLIEKYKDKVKWRINPLLFCENVEKNKLSISKNSFIKIYNFYEKVYEDFGIKIIIGEKNPLSIKYKQYLNSEFDSCLAGITTFGILSNGDVVNCMVCRDKVLGNVYRNDSIVDIWRNQNLDKKPLCERHYDSKNSYFSR